MSDQAAVDVQAVEIVVSSRTLPGWRRDLRLLLGVGAIAGVLIVGIGGRVLELGVPAVGPGREVGDAVVRPALADGPVASIAAPPITLDEPAAGSLVRGSTITLRGTQRAAMSDLVVEARLGRLSLGRRSIAALPSGPFELVLPVYAPRIPALVQVRLTPATAMDRPAVSATIGLSSRSAVEVWSVSSRVVAGRCRIHADGPASLDVRSLRVDVLEDAATLVRASVGVSEDATSTSARPLGLGRWAGDFDWPSPHRRGARGGVLRLEVSWDDPADGSSSRLSVAFASCAAG
jgi:hypothetical protein